MNVTTDQFTADSISNGGLIALGISFILGFLAMGIEGPWSAFIVMGGFFLFMASAVIAFIVWVARNFISNGVIKSLKLAGFFTGAVIALILAGIYTLLFGLVIGAVIAFGIMAPILPEILMPLTIIVYLYIGIGWAVNGLSFWEDTSDARVPPLELIKTTRNGLHLLTNALH